MLKKVAIGLFLCFAVCLVVFLLGPRIPIDKTIHNRNVPKEPGKLEAYLQKKEGQFNDLRPGTNKQIIWADPTRKQQTPVSIVYVHGFSATRQETAPLSNQLAKKIGANLYYARLAGHGRTGDALAKQASVNRWLNDMVESYQIGCTLGRKVIVIAGSTGATLATWMATEFDSKRVLSYIFISPNFAPKKKIARVLLLPWGGAIARMVSGSHREWKPINKSNAKYWTYRYPVEALLPVMGLVKMMDETNYRDFKAPLLIIYSQKDKVISAARIQEIYPKLGTTKKQLRAFDDSQDPAHHVLAGDAISPKSTTQLATMMYQFVKPLLPPPTTAPVQTPKSAPTKAPASANQAPSKRTTATPNKPRVTP